MTISETTPAPPSDTATPISHIFCATLWDAHTLYRRLPAPTQAPSRPSEATPSPTSSSGNPTSPSSPPAEEVVQTSRAWIAGAVVGPLAAVALFAAAAVLLVRRRRIGHGGEKKAGHAERHELMGRDTPPKFQDQVQDQTGTSFSEMESIGVHVVRPA